MVEKIEALGAECWLDEKDLSGGDVIADQIIRGVRACNEAVILSHQIVLGHNGFRLRLAQFGGNVNASRQF